ncbi:hypothetical protein IAE22_33270, partial [Bacillus sp. S34]|nr:hypothetical protein [Bacillus sp. S34]
VGTAFTSLGAVAVGVAAFVVALLGYLVLLVATVARFVLAPTQQQPQPAVGNLRPVLLPQRTRKA